jgi:uncharacterized SAM-binding protein YcdF (DUF218 family)
MFTLFLFASMTVLFAYIVYNYNSSIVLRLLLVLICMVFFVIAVFGVYALIAFLLINAWVVLKRETRTPAHCLTLVLAVALILYIIIINVFDVSGWSPITRVLIYWIQGMGFCYAVHVTQYIVATVLCNLSRPHKNQDYIIVHGAGLINGNVSPLLAKRVDKAIEFYNSRKEARTPPKLLMSGGQGPDESRPEAEAMAEYARGKGISESDILLESQSTNTLENMRFAKQIMEMDSKNKSFRAIYSTSNYHLLRTGIYARKAGMKISGIGSKTAFYYVPVALLREYIAYIVMHWKMNIAFFVLSFLLSCAFVVVILRFT